MKLLVENIHTYYGLSHILSGVSLSVNGGEVVGLLGRNGAGKSTTLRSIMGLSPPTSGTIFYNGKVISRLKPHKIARMGIAYVPESRDVFSHLTVKENLTLALNPSSSWSLDRVFAWFPPMRELLAKKGRNLSGGEQQMLAIGRAVLTGPSLLLMDEPSQGLAPVIVNVVLDMLRDLQKEKLSILLVEQNVKIALILADTIYILSDGEIKHQSPSQDLEPATLDKFLGVSI